MESSTKKIEKIGVKDTRGVDIRIGDVCHKDHTRTRIDWSTGMKKVFKEFVIVRVEPEDTEDKYWFKIIDRGNCTDGFIADGWSKSALTNNIWVDRGKSVELTIIGNYENTTAQLVKKAKEFNLI